ncbi:MAG: hypothetical protein Pg6C_01740 [Treponemataceae bacterium]|nr:MAG: hypothetical protein Pg6C_01740 [Treponemataceae bacterium]
MKSNKKKRSGLLPGFAVLCIAAIFSFTLAGCDNPSGGGGGDDPALPVTYTVTFDLDGGNIGGNTENPAAQTVAAGGTVTNPGNAAKSGRAFSGWFNGDVRWNFDSGTVSGNVTLKARYDTVTYTVTFDLDGGNISGNTANPANQTIAQGGRVDNPGNPQKNGYAFTGWYNGTAQWNFDSGTVTATMTLKAKWTAAYTITYNYGGATGGNSSAAATVTSGASYTLAVPVKSYNTFGGWWSGSGGTGTQYTGANGASLANWSGTANITLYAKWTQTDVQKIEQAFGTATGNPLVVTIPAGIALPGQFYANRNAISAGLGNSSVNVNLNLSGCTGITEWENNTLYDNMDKIAGLTLPDTVVMIRNSVLSRTYYRNLTSVSGAGVTEIEELAFYNSPLTTASFPAVQIIYQTVFRGCTGLISLTLPASPPTQWGNIFPETNTGPALYIHVGSAAAVSAYTAATGWNVSATTAAGGNTAKYGNQHKAINIVN